jgi:hypothetical protein
MPKSPQSNSHNESLHRPTRPVRAITDDTDLVLTPGGMRPRSLVHILEHGQHVSLKGGRIRIIETATGRVVKDLGESAKQGDTGGSAENEKVPAGQPGKPIPALPDIAWIENSQWRNGGTDPIVYFSTKWLVPPVPSSNDSQTVFLFNGMQPDSAAHILQPVLQWGGSGAGGGNYWSITNWYADGQGGAAVTWPPIQVNVGDVLQGVMTCTGQSGTEYNYTSSFVGYSSVDVTVTDADELTWAYETLECYGSNYTLPLTQCSDYPDTPLTAMYDIEVKTGTPGSSGTDATLDWVAVTAFTDCGQSCQIISNDSPGGAVYLYYSQSAAAQNFYFIIDKGSFGKDEVSDVITSNHGLFPAAFYLAVEGFTVQQLTIDEASLVQPTLSGAFDSLTGVTVSPSATYPPVYDASNLYTPQRILFPFDVTFKSSSLPDFPSTGVTPELLTGSISIGSATLGNVTNLSTNTVLYLVAGADPYFTNIDPNQHNEYYLSQDLRVFTITPEANNATPIGGVKFTFQTGSPTSLDTAAAYTYIGKLLDHFNTTYTSPGGTDPFDLTHPVLPGQSGALTGDSSVTPATPNPADKNKPFMNYNFAIARVRLMGSSGTAGEAANVRVFFRLFTTQTFDTDYINVKGVVSSADPNITYPSSPSGSPNAPTAPLPGTDANGNINGCTLPFFAAANQSDLASGGVNNQTIQIPSGSDSVWSYFGCFLDVYDPSYLIGGQTAQHWLSGGTHHCLVAQIAYADSPIENSNGVIENPESSDKLAQRNLQVSPSGNPGFPITHRIPQTFDTRPSPTPGTGYLADFPDELMIDWRNIPAGSIAEIYWPQVNASQVVSLAATLYPTSTLSASDSHTISCAVSSGYTYVPIPTGGTQNFAGLITLQVPTGIRVGNQFEVVIRRITSRRVDEKGQGANRARSVGYNPLNWRYIVGSFQVTIPVQNDATILPVEENLLSILKWRLQLLAPTDRWYPVLQRYITLVTARVSGLGGNPGQIEPSQYGTANQIEGTIVKVPHHEHPLEFTGKVSALRYNRFGDFDGFDLITLEGERRYFRAHEADIEALLRDAWLGRILITVCAPRHDSECVSSILLLRPPHDPGI